MQLYVNGSNIKCDFDSDCPLSSLCYYPLDEMINDTKNSIQYKQCGCNIDTGFVGPFCASASANTVYRLLMASMFILLCIYIIDAIIPDIRNLMKKNRDKRYYGVGDDDRMNTLIKCIATLVFTILLELFNILIVSENDKMEIIPFDGMSYNKKKSIYSPVRYVMHTFIFLSFSMAILNIGVIWIGVSLAARTIKGVSIRKCKKLAFVFNGVICLTLFIMSILFPLFSVVFMIPILCFLVAIFSYGAYSISKAMKEIQVNNRASNAFNDLYDKPFKKVYLQIRRSALWIIGCLIGILVSLSLSVSYYMKMRAYIQPISSIYFGAVFADISFAFLLCAIWGILRYTRLYIHDENASETDGVGARHREVESESSTKRGAVGSLGISAIHSPFNNPSTKAYPDFKMRR